MIREGDTVIIRMHDDESSHMLMVKGTQKLFKRKVDVVGLVGAPYGSIFEVGTNNVTRVKDGTILELDDVADTEIAASGSEGMSSNPNEKKNVVVKGDNSNYNDTNTAQKLTVDEIKKLKAQGASGSAIIQSLIANSDTWNAKTEFAQEKWLKRKAKRYIKLMRVMETTPTTLCEVYHTKSRDKICGLRHDSLAHILSHSGVWAGSRVLLVETCVGLLVGSFAYRMQGAGAIMAMYTGLQPHFELVDALNLSDDATSIIQPFSSKEMSTAVSDVLKDGFMKTTEEPAYVKPAFLEANPEKESTWVPGRSHNSTGRKPQDVAKVRWQLRLGMNSLVMACRYNIIPILKKALHLLVPSSPIVLYCEFVEPLNEAYLFLNHNDLALRMIVSDTWMREFQTLPGRVHPQMYMTTSSGYILTGVYAGGIENVGEGTHEEGPSTKKSRKE